LFWPSQVEPSSAKPSLTETMGKPEENDNKYVVAFAARLQRSLVVFRGGKVVLS